MTPTPEQPQPKSPSRHDPATMTCPLCQRLLQPPRPPTLLLRRSPVSRLPAPPRRRPPAHHRAHSPAQTTDHRLRMPRLRRARPRPAALRRLLNLYAQGRPRRRMPLLRRAHPAHRTPRPGGDHPKLNYSRHPTQPTPNQLGNSGDRQWGISAIRDSCPTRCIRRHGRCRGGLAGAPWVWRRPVRLVPAFSPLRFSTD